MQIEADTARLLEQSSIVHGDTVMVEGLGLADALPALSSAIAQSLAATPLAPVHGRSIIGLDGALTLRWVRRSRIDFGWRDGVDQAMVEGFEQYGVALMVNGQAIKEYLAGQSSIEISAAEWTSLAIPESANVTAEVRQIGKHRQSPPLTIAIS